MCCTDDCDTGADEFFEALVHVREQVEAAFAEASAECENPRPESETREQPTLSRDATSLVKVYLELASRDEWTE
jgi:hypothetical protein